MFSTNIKALLGYNASQKNRSCMLGMIYTNKASYTKHQNNNRPCIISITNIMENREYIVYLVVYNHKRFIIVNEQSKS